jgi:hypothetical protein
LVNLTFVFAKPSFDLANPTFALVTTTMRNTGIILNNAPFEPNSDSLWWHAAKKRGSLSNENKMSDGWRDSASLRVAGGISWKVRN